MTTFTTTEEHVGSRLDVVIAAALDISRTRAKELVDLGAVQYNDAVCTKPSVKVEEGICIAADLDAKPVKKERDEVPLEQFKVRIVHEDPNYLIVEKPAGLLVHQTMAGEKSTLVAWLLERYPDIKGVGEGEYRSGIVHRLDRMASGLLVIARTQEMHAHLKKQFQARTMQKEYTVLVHGHVDKDHNTIDFPIDRGKDGKMVSRPRKTEITLKNVMKQQPGKDAKTEYWLTSKYLHYSLLRVKIHTGRTHQIRVHMHAHGHPVVGDTLYFQKQWVRQNAIPLGRLFLHATTLGFTDLNGEAQQFSVELPVELGRFLENIKHI